MQTPPDDTPQARAERIAQQLSMHTVEEAKQALLPDPKKEEQQALDDPKLKETYTFNFSKRDYRGVLYEGRFENQIMNLDMMQTRGGLIAHQLGGKPIDSIPADTLAYTSIVCWLALSLNRKPKWAEDFGKLYDLSIVEAVFKEVSAHERTFRRLPADEKDGAAEG